MTSVVHCKKDEHDIYIGRGSKWGNPFKIGEYGSREQVILKYRLWINSQPQLLKVLPELKGKVLGCYCAPQKCHGDVLVELANSKWIKNWFSNMLLMDHPIVHQGIPYKTVENFYQAMKMPKDRTDLRSKLAQMPAHKSKTAIRKKKEFPWRDDWDKNMALDVMSLAISHKFKLGTSWADKLELTEDWLLAEYNNWKDTYWGIDLNTMCGENMLGKLLMDVRDKIGICNGYLLHSPKNR